MTATGVLMGDWMGGGGRESMCNFGDAEFQSLAPYLPALLSLSLSYISLAAGVEVTCLGLCPESNCLLVDVTDGPRILVDCPLEPLGMKISGGAIFPLPAVFVSFISRFLFLSVSISPSFAILSCRRSHQIGFLG